MAKRKQRPGGSLTAGSGVSGTITLQGAEELDILLKSLGPALEKKVLRKAMRDAAKPILTAAKQNCPVDSGDLKRSLKIKAIKRTRKHRVGVVVSTEKGFFKGETFYGSFIEFGMPTRGIPARPFIRPAFDANKALSVKIVSLSVKSALDDLENGLTKLSKLDPDAFLPEASDEDYEAGTVPVV